MGHGYTRVEPEYHAPFRSGGKNANADALSRSPLPRPDGAQDSTPERVVATVNVEQDALPTLKKQDPELVPIFTYLETGVLPREDRFARTIALMSSQYLIEDGVLYHIEPNSTLRLIPPSRSRERLFQEAHGGVFGAHLSDTKVHSELRKHYWWLGMRAVIARWSKDVSFVLLILLDVQYVLLSPPSP